MFKQAIIMFQDYLELLGYKAQIHFELEGCFESVSGKSLDLTAINKTLSILGIDGEIVNEYWKNQWEYVSLFNGQSPLEEANNLSKAINKLPEVFAQYGVSKTLIKPVVWSGDKGKLAFGCNDIFSTDTRAVHIPNAIQLNISVLNNKGDNIVPEPDFGEYLQQCLLNTSKACCLLYLPEEEAFERFKLTSDYGLADELCSPFDISGGHQGSIALYKELGKHNQKMGLEPLLYDQFNQVLTTQYNWKKTARVEHRLGASSTEYDPYINILFSLANVVDAVEAYLHGSCGTKLEKKQQRMALPVSLFTTNNRNQFTINDHLEDKRLGAIDLFSQCDWFSNSINRVQKLIASQTDSFLRPENLGTQIKREILAKYELKEIHYNF